MNKWIPTPKSSNVAGFCYDSVNKILTVEFKKSGRYDYKRVPNKIYEGLKSAKSKGEYVNKKIKGFFDFSKHKSKVSQTSD